MATRVAVAKAVGLLMTAAVREQGEGATALAAGDVAAAGAKAPDSKAVAAEKVEARSAELVAGCRAKGSMAAETQDMAGGAMVMDWVVGMVMDAAVLEVREVRKA